jgi:predicted outer membrane protein
MLKDHTTSSTELKQLAKQKDIDLKQELPEAKKEVIEEITSKSGGQFDQAYMACEIAGHRMAAVHYQNGTDFLKDQELKSFAQKYLPVIEQHRAMVDKEGGRTTQQQSGQQPAAGTAGTRPQQQPTQQQPQQQQQQQPGQVRTE